jgi:hypothetical protein
LAESFPSVVGEAMACGVPCVVTDAGDSASIVGDTGIAVPRGDSSRLGSAIAELLALSPDARHRMGYAARSRVQASFSIERATVCYEELYERVVGTPPRAAGGREVSKASRLNGECGPLVPKAVRSATPALAVTDASHDPVRASEHRKGWRTSDEDRS